MKVFGCKSLKVMIMISTLKVFGWKSLKVMIMISTLKVLGWKSLKVAPNESKDCEGRNVSGPYLTRLHTQERDNNKDCLKIIKDKAFL